MTDLYQNTSYANCKPLMACRDDFLITYQRSQHVFASQLQLKFDVLYHQTVSCHLDVSKLHTACKQVPKWTVHASIFEAMQARACMSVPNSIKVCLQLADVCLWL